MGIAETECRASYAIIMLVMEEVRHQCVGDGGGMPLVCGGLTGDAIGMWMKEEVPYKCVRGQDECVGADDESTIHAFEPEGI